MDGADGGARQRPAAAAQLLPNFRGPPVGVLPFQSDDVLLQDERELVGVPIRAPAADGQPVNYVSAAIGDIAAKRPVAKASTKPYGCGVKY